MRKLLAYPDRVPALAGVLCLVAASLVTGCASKNPLIDGAASASPAAPQATAAPAAATGVQTTQQRRFFGIFSPYRVDIQQGNFISREMIAQLTESMKSKDGMSPEQVRFVLGTPLLTDIFHKDRWDYLFRLQKSNGEVTTSRVTLFFKNNRLERFEGGDLPTEKDYLAHITGAVPMAASPAAAGTK